MNNLAQELIEAGFPIITRWEVENNQHRKVTVDGKPSLPPIGALLSEIGDDVFLWQGHLWKGEQKLQGWFAATGVQGSFKEDYYVDTEANRKSGYAGQPFIKGYLDDGMVDPEFASTPEEVLVKLYIESK